MNFLNFLQGAQALLTLGGVLFLFYLWYQVDIKPSIRRAAEGRKTRALNQIRPPKLA